MNNMMRYIIICLFPFFVYAQQINIGEIKTIKSKVLKEEREFWVYLPEHYSDEKYKNQQYPVIYLLDGEKFFHVASGIVKNMANGYYPQMPECIIIGIKNTERSRDLTPTHVSSVSYESGGSSNFEIFINQELIPEINKNYKTLNYKVLVGHSFGGLYTLHTLFKKSKYFNAYIAIDPSLWWDENVVVNQLAKKLNTTVFKGKTLFIANANSIGSQKEPSKQHQAHFLAKKEAIKLIEKSENKSLNYQIKYYQNEDHGSVVVPSLIDAFRFVFTGFRIDVKALVKNPTLLEKQYKEFSKKIGFNFKPQSAYVDKVVDLAIKRGEKENAKILHQINIDLYPENTFLKNKNVEN